jgi:hypothetical protein
MHAIRQIIDDAPETIPVPPEMRHRRVEVIFFPLDEEPQAETDALGWPIGFFESTFGSIPDFPEREPQGEYEVREPLE